MIMMNRLTGLMLISWVVFVPVLSVRSVLRTDPQVSMNISEVIRFNGYPCEDHEAVTADGYILSLQRIPHGAKERLTRISGTRPVALLQHGLVDSAHTWTNNGPQQSLAFILADHGYDVWLANSRGSTYSYKHQQYSPDDPRYWDFSWDEMAKYDLPAVVAHVLATSGNASQLVYIGHSQGTEIAFAQLSNDPWLVKKIKAYVALAPVAFLNHVEAGLRILSRFREEIEVLLKLFGHGKVFSSSAFVRLLASTLCSEKGVPKICAEAIFLMAGVDTKNLNESRLPIYIGHTPAGTSVKNIVHYAQSVISGNFEMYDYGKDENIKRYGTPTPPQYSLQPNGVPTALFSGGNDTLADPTDVRKLVSMLAGDVKFQKQVPYYNHLDFVWGEDAFQVIYPDLLQFLQKYR